MARSSQEKLEKLYFEGFIRAYPHLPDGKIEFGDRPDVMIFGDDVLGVEIANLYIKHGSDFSSEQRQAHLRLKVIEKSQEEFLKKGYPQYEFWLDFDPECPIENADKLSEKLSSLIVGLFKNQPDKRDFYKPFLDCPELRFITYNGVVYSDSKWNSVQVYDVPLLNQLHVEGLVENKIRKLNEYKKCDRYWLLLVVDFWDRAQDQNIPINVSFKISKTPFEKILIYKTATQEWVEVQQI